MTGDEVDYGGVKWSQDTGQADWLAGRLAPFGSGLLTSVVPGGFEAYARVLHPAEESGPGRILIRWREVAAWSGMPLLPGTQFHEIALPEHAPTLSAPWADLFPRTGSLTAGDAAVLAEILAGATATPGDCWFCLWDGYGMWDDRATAALIAARGPGPADLVSPRPPTPGAGPSDLDSSGMAARHAVPAPFPVPPRQDRLVELPGREYRLGRGPVTAAVTMTESLDQSPNLWWPADRAWCVASEIDLVWTYVGGPAALIGRLVADSRIEAQPATPGESCHRRVTGWLAETIDRAVASLLDSGTATIETSRGIVQATLHRPTRLRWGVLHIDYGDPSNLSARTTSMLSDRSEDQLRDEVSRSLMDVVIDLAGG